MYKNTWIVVANGSKARFFLAESNNELKEMSELIEEESRMKGEEILTDKPGRSFDSFGAGRHQMESSTDLKEEIAKKFAKEVMDHMEELENDHRVNQLFIIAAPKFLGMIQNHLNPSLKGCLQGTIDKDLTSFPPEKIRHYLPEVL